MNNLASFSESLQEAAAGLGGSFVETSALVIVAVVVFIIGWVIGILVARVIEQLVKAIKLDTLLSSAGVDDLAKRMGTKLNSGRFLGEVGKWYVIVVSLLLSFDILGLEQVTQFLSDVAITYLPRVITAILILIIAAVVAEVMRKVVVAGSKGAGITSAKLLGSLTKWSIWIFGILVAMVELGIAVILIERLFTGIVVAFALALGLAFGLGGQDAARDTISKIRREIGDHHS
jgi:small-conductance mechanosensitive channel